MNLTIISQTESNRKIKKNYLPIQKFDREASDMSEFIMVLKFVEFLMITFPDRLMRLLALCVFDRTQALKLVVLPLKH
jgi:hypothetical protein